MAALLGPSVGCPPRNPLGTVQAGWLALNGRKTHPSQRLLLPFGPSRILAQNGASQPRPSSQNFVVLLATQWASVFMISVSGGNSCLSRSERPFESGGEELSWSTALVSNHLEWW